ncbi:DUF2090 domain-containing protein [candidate division WWE3 bacterium]|nr:DUF2090 domain-containing protein [candidate division WWE3 bacterium]
MNSITHMSSTSLFEKNGQYLMLALDHRQSFQKMVEKIYQTSVDTDQLISIKKSIIEASIPHVSGMLIDPDYGIPAYKKIADNSVPYLVCIEKSGYEGPADNRITTLEYDIKTLQSFNAQGVKLLLYVNPHVSSFENQMELARTVLEQSHEANLPLFLELVMYGAENDPEKNAQLMIDSITKFLEHNIVPDVFKLEFPYNQSYAQQITEMLGKTPWILLTRGVTFDEFHEQLGITAKAGVKGYLAGRAVWQDCIYPDRIDTETIQLRYKKLAEVMQG